LDEDGIPLPEWKVEMLQSMNQLEICETPPSPSKPVQNGYTPESPVREDDGKDAIRERVIDNLRKSKYSEQGSGSRSPLDEDGLPMPRWKLALIKGKTEKGPAPPPPT